MTRPTASRDPDQGGWRSALGGYLAADQPATDGHPVRTPMALQFELREALPRTAYRWNGPRSQKVAPSGRPDLGPEFRLGVRPVAATTRGWARRGITWTNLTHLAGRLDLDVAHHRWCCELGGLYRAADTATSDRDPDWLYLDSFSSPALWPLLRQAADLGVALVGVGADSRVRIADAAIIGLDASRDGAGLVLAPVCVIDGVRADPAHVRSVGGHGIYLVDPSRPRNILLAPSRSPLDAQQLALLRQEPVRVPPDGVAEFLSDYLPDLRDRLEVASSDATVVLPEPGPPVLVLTATHRARHTLTLAWHWAGRRGSAPPLPDVLPAGLLPADWITEGQAAPDGVTLQAEDTAEFVLRTLPALQQLPGVRVVTAGRPLDYRELTGPPSIEVTVIPADKHDWLDLAVTVTVDGHVVPFVPLFKALAQGRRRLLLVDRSYLSLGHPSLQRLRELIEESREVDEWEPRPSISRHQVALWSDFEDLADVAAPAVAWRALVAEAGSGQGPRQVAPPRGLATLLRPYQQEGLSWLAFLWRHRLGGILADDMGLGKTIQVLALAQHLAETGAAGGPLLVVAPTSVGPNWVSETQRFAPRLRVRQLTGTQASGRATVAEIAADADIVVTSYALLRLDFDAYQQVATSTGWGGLVLDEAQFVKNPSSRVHECALELPAPIKVALTGTPLENSLADLQALCAIVAPGLFPSAPRFAREYIRPIEQPRTGITRGVGAGTAPEVAAEVRQQRLAKLRSRIRPFLLRRTKDQVAAELPVKQEQTLRIELAPAHRELYDVFLQRERQKLFQLLQEEKRNKFIVFRSLTLLRLLALDPSLIGEQYADLPSAKLDALLELLQDVRAEGHRALVFSQFTSYLKKVGTRLAAAGIDYEYLDGSTRHRAGVIEKFRAGTAPAFLISLKAGGFGVNLTEADYVFLLDPWWNPAAEAQAVDRAHRIGQDKQVMVYRLIAAGTIEEKVLALKDRKAALFDAVVESESMFSAPLDPAFGRLAEDDIRTLLS